jgi:glycerophosphoryl diester phosphodiesterase
VREASLAELRSLDAGHGYSADGETFPFRGKGARIETLAEVARAMPRRGRLMVHLASDNPALVEGIAAAYRKAGRDPVEAEDAFYGPAEAIAAIRDLFPGVWAFNPDAARQCTADYIAQGWSGFLPESCKGRTMLIALGEQALLWGWPNRLIARMGAHGGRIVIEGPQASAAGPIAGVTLPEQLTQIPASFNGYIWSGDAFTTLPALITRFDDRTQEEIDASQAALERRRASQ